MLGRRFVRREVTGSAAVRESQPLADEYLASSSRDPQSGRLLPWRAVAVALTAAAVAVATVAISAGNGAPTRGTGSVSRLAGVRLTRADVQHLEHMTPSQAATLTRDINTAYASLGVHVGLGTPGSAVAPGQVVPGQNPAAATDGATLTSAQWAGGVQWDHVWVTASYANLEAEASNFSAVVQVSTAFCARLGASWLSVACGAVGTLIAIILSRVHVTYWSRYHGIWAAYYWFPWVYRTGGTW